VPLIIHLAEEVKGNEVPLDLCGSDRYVFKAVPFRAGACVGSIGYLHEHEHLFKRRVDMSGSTYTIVELVGTSSKSWEDAAKTAVETASGTLRDLRVAEVVKLDLTVEKGKVALYRARVNLSFKYAKGK